MCRDLGSCIILFDEVLMILPIWPFPGCGGRGGCGRYPRSGPRCVRAPPSGVCPAGGLQCALLVLVPVGAVGLSWPGGGLFWPVGGGAALRSGVYAASGLRWRFAGGFGFRHCLWLLLGAAFAKVKSSASARRLSRFIAQVGFSDTLLVVSILDMKGLSLNSDLKF